MVMFKGGVTPQQKMLKGHYPESYITEYTQYTKINMSQLKHGGHFWQAFNDRQTVLADEDESEKLRVGCIKVFLKLTSWFCGTNLSTLDRQRAWAHQTGEAE